MSPSNNTWQRLARSCRTDGLRACFWQDSHYRPFAFIEIVQTEVEQQATDGWTGVETTWIIGNSTQHLTAAGSEESCQQCGNVFRWMRATKNKAERKLCPAKLWRGGGKNLQLSTQATSLNIWNLSTMQNRRSSLITTVLLKAHSVVSMLCQNEVLSRICIKMLIWLTCPTD